MSHPHSKRRKQSGNENHMEEVRIYEPSCISEAIALLKSGEIEVAIINAGLL